MQFGTRAARPRVSHLPEVIRRPETEDAIGGEPDLLPPDPVGLFIILVDGGVKPVLVDVIYFGDQLPSEGHGLLLEIIPEGKVAEHLEKRVMLSRPADLVQVVVLAADPHAFLDRGGPDIASSFQSEEDVLELIHPGVGEQERRVVLGQKRRARNNLMSAPGEIFEERFPDVLSVHSE